MSEQLIFFSFFFFLWEGEGYYLFGVLLVWFCFFFCLVGWYRKSPSYLHFTEWICDLIHICQREEMEMQWLAYWYDHASGMQCASHSRSKQLRWHRFWHGFLNCHKPWQWPIAAASWDGLAQILEVCRLGPEVGNSSRFSCWLSALDLPACPGKKKNQKSCLIGS